MEIPKPGLSTAHIQSACTAYLKDEFFERNSHSEDKEIPEVKQVNGFYNSPEDI